MAWCFFKRKDSLSLRDKYADISLTRHSTVGTVCTVVIAQAYHTAQYVVPCGGIFLGKWRSSFAGSSDDKMNIQSACILNTRYYPFNTENFCILPTRRFIFSWMNMSDYFPKQR
jgi:hypothetical protein